MQKTDDGIVLDIGKSPGTQSSYFINAHISAEEVGYSIFQHFGADITLANLHVEQEHRGQGIGSLLVKNVVEIAKNHPKAETLTTFAYNERVANSFCKHFNLDKLEFSICGTVKNGYEDTTVDLTPEQAVKILATERLEEFDDFDGAFSSDQLSFGIGIRATLL